MSKHFRLPGRLPGRLRAAGVSVPALLKDAGLPAGLLDQPRILLTTEEFFALWQAIGRATKNPAIGLELATEQNSSDFDPMILAALATPTFGEAMRQVSRYKLLSCPEEILHEVDDEEWRLHFRWLMAEGEEPEVLTELCFAWVLSIGRHGTGTKISPLRVELTNPRGHARVIERHFGCPVVFGTARNSIVFRASDGELPFVTSNAELLGMLAPQLDKELKQQRGDETFPERVKATIQRKLSGRRPKMQEIARELRMSSRTLQRKLQDEGFSFQQVLEQARHQLARHYLNHSRLELNEAAYLLGYEDSNSFVRAFRGWEGVPPGLWREVQRMSATT
jgi:AraC-like DNA-binding protein